MDFDSTNTESKFNAGIAYLMRIDKILTCCWQASFNGDYMSWYKHLTAFYRELIVKLDEKEDESIWGKSDSIFDAQKDSITRENSTFVNLNRMMNDKINNKKQTKEIMFMLNCIEIKLRILAQKKSMLLPNKMDFRGL
jgi:hypothetical protein